LWAVATVTIMIILVVAGWFLGIQPALAAVSQAEGERATVQAQIIAQEATIASLEKEQKNLPKLKKAYDELATSIPGDADTSDFIDGLDALAVAAAVQIVGFTVAEPAPYAVPSSAIPDAAPDPSADAAPAPRPTDTGPAPAPIFTSPLITADNFVVIQIGVDVVGTYDAFLSFVNGLQSGDRLFLVTGLTSDAVGDGTVNAHVNGYIYVLADPSS
jgi:Tfp pilus assembly protein PilO